MKFKKTKAAALTLAAVLATGVVSGCSLVTKDSIKDLSRVVAEVDITNSDEFAANGQYAAYKNTIEKTEILKRDLVADFASIGNVYVNSYGYSVEDTYDLIKDSLVNRQIFLQYAKVYFFGDGTHTPEGFNAARAAARSEAEKKWGEIYKDNADLKDFMVNSEEDVAGLAYFLDEDDIASAEYALRVSFNSTLDSHEEEVIESGHTHDHTHDDGTTTTERTTPTGVDTENEDYFDPTYKVYTGLNTASECGSYETIDESTPSTRKKAYKNFLANLKAYGLIQTGENTSDITKLSYFAVERKAQYENAIVTKLTEKFEEDVEEKINESWIKEEKFDKTLASQQEQFLAENASALESALDGVSDSNYVLYAPDGYGFVINILLPFSTRQTQDLDDSPADFGDIKGNKFVKRASLLRNLTATDQRTSWFTDAQYEYEDATAYTGGDANRKYVFFENNMTKSTAADGEAKYEPIKNYIGKYTYNGIVEKTEDEDGETEYAFQPNRISIDMFLDELKGYLKDNGVVEFTVENETYPNGEGAEYYQRDVSQYYKDGDLKKEVDYSKFLYYEGKIAGFENFDVNKIFEKGSRENAAMSVINELSFAYNTDTAGLNTYLGYAVSPNNTDFVKEFEYAAQRAVAGGAGTITVAPSDYGWHIMYCTFSYSGNNTPYRFDWNDIEKEGTFSNLYYEALKASNLESYSTDLRASIITSFDNDACVTLYENRYKDLWEN